MGASMKNTGEIEQVILVEEDLDGVSDDALEEVSEAISNAISNKTGFCHMGFTYTIVVEAVLDKTE
jgi:hypothetical protein